jgi:TPR repeat protein
LAKMGATLEEAQSAIQTLKYEKATSTHPAKKDRLVAIEKGWNKGKGNKLVKIKEEVSINEGDNYFTKGEIAFQQRNYTDAILYFNKAKDMDFKDSYYYLSIMYYDGLGTTIDWNKSYNLAKHGYELGSIPSTYMLGLCITNGKGVANNQATGERLFQKDFQAKWFKNKFKITKAPIYANAVGILYAAGWGGVEKDDEIALYWFKEAAKLGDISAQNEIGNIYSVGKGVQKDEAVALEWFEKAAANGFALSQSNLGLAYNFGKGVAVDFEKSAYWYRKAAEQGYYKAQNNLGVCYINGTGVDKNYNQAIYWFRKAAEQGHPNAQDNLNKLGESW